MRRCSGELRTGQTSSVNCARGDYAPCGLNLFSSSQPLCVPACLRSNAFEAAQVRTSPFREQHLLTARDSLNGSESGRATSSASSNSRHYRCNYVLASCEEERYMVWLGQAHRSLRRTPKLCQPCDHESPFQHAEVYPRVGGGLLHGSQ